MAKRMAYFSDVSGTLIEGPRVQLRVRRADGSTVRIDGSQEEIGPIAAPKKQAEMVTLGLTYPDGKQKPVTFQVRAADLKSQLPAPVFTALEAATATTNGSNGSRASRRSTPATGTFVCSCGRTFAKRQGLTRHITAAGQGHEPAVSST